MKVNTDTIMPKSPSDTKTEEFAHKGWRFVFTKGGILPSNELDQALDALALNNIPDVVFGYSSAQLISEKHNFVYEVTARESLRLCNFGVRDNRLMPAEYARSREVNHANVLPTEVKVKFADKWSDRYAAARASADGGDIKTIDQISDCFFATGYKGTVLARNADARARELALRADAQRKIDVAHEGDAAAFAHPFFTEATVDDIPVGNLTEKNPILWHNMVHLWEDELGDNGLSISEFRFRVMDDCFFGLLRHYLRVDDVLIRIYDTRIYHDFAWNYVLREFQVREDTFAALQSKGFAFTPQWMVDQGQSHQVYPHVAQRQIVKDKILLE